MSSIHDPSIEELRAQAELSRAALAANVTELRGRIARVTSPANLKAEARAYVRHERESLVDNLRRRASDNPLQAAAVAAAAAYPTLSLARAIPVPLMLIGAGLFLTTKRGRDSSATMQAKMNDASRRVSETVGEMTETVAKTASGMSGNVTSRVSETVSGLRDQAAAAAGTISASAEGIVPGAATPSEGTEAVTARLATMAAETMQDVSSRASRAAQGVSARASRAGGSASRFASDNAVLLAGIGVIAGALLAASFPVSNAENRVLGPGKRRVKDAARAAAAMGMDKAGGVVASVVESVSSTAAREGLDGSSLQQAVGDLTEKARGVAERSVDAALDQDRQGHQGHPEHQQQEQQSFSERNST
jgi:hypothetical protein